MFHSYVLYPFILKILARNKKENSIVYKKEDELPFISIIMSVHNEEMVLVDKIRSIYYTLYPFNKFEVIVGSDASTDGTNRICKVYSGNYGGFRFYSYKRRQGKPAVINQLVKHAKGDILVLTDAKVTFKIDTLIELIKHFKNPEIDIVGGNILNSKQNKKGISIQEKAFMSREISIKYNEGKIWGNTMGIYGAIYAIRKKAYNVVPDKFSVDDFYITLKVLEKNKKVIMSLSADTLEDVPDLIKTEFQRKVRISSGNFQNLQYFSYLLLKPWKSVSFAFISHKVIRWLGPFLLILSYIFCALLFKENKFFQYLFFSINFLFFFPIFDFVLRKLNIHIVFLRFISHFLIMNLALLIGFIKYLFKRQTNIWQPTKR